VNRNISARSPFLYRDGQKRSVMTRAPGKIACTHHNPAPEARNSLAQVREPWVNLGKDGEPRRRRHQALPTRSCARPFGGSTARGTLAPKERDGGWASAQTERSEKLGSNKRGPFLAAAGPRAAKRTAPLRIGEPHCCQREVHYQMRQIPRSNSGAVLVLMEVVN
jgi:hypothetical protein